MPSSFRREQRAEAISIGQKASKYYVARGSPDRFVLSFAERCERSLLSKPSLQTLLLCERVKIAQVSGRAGRARDTGTMADLGRDRRRGYLVREKFQFSARLFDRNGQFKRCGRKKAQHQSSLNFTRIIRHNSSWIPEDISVTVL